MKTERNFKTHGPLFIFLEIRSFYSNESVKLNRPIGPATVILNKEQSLNLPETLRICCEIGAGFVYMPLYCVDQLVGAPEALMALINLAFYKDEDELIQKVFGGGD